MYAAERDWLLDGSRRSTFSIGHSSHVRPILLGEQGVVVRRRVLPWASFKRASWHHLLPNWLMLYGSERAYAAAAPEAIKSDVEAFVRTKTRFEKDERKLAPGF